VAGFWEASVAATVLATALFGWLLYRVMGRQGGLVAASGR
jgi:MATE family multidrug resistance protein